MKKKMTAIIMVFCLVFSLFTVPTSAIAKKAKYVKVKAATYKTYKKTYNENKRLKNQIRAKNNAISVHQNAVKQRDQRISELQEQLDSANSMNRWVWSNINSMGIDYNNKTWTIPSEMPEKFVIDGVTYKVVQEE